MNDIFKRLLHRKRGNKDDNKMDNIEETYERPLYHPHINVEEGKTQVEVKDVNLYILQLSLMTITMKMKEVVHVNKFQLREKASNGDANALFELAEMYRYGYLVDKDENKALELANQAAMIGSGDALDLIGDFLCYGFCVEKDEKQAFNYYNEAARLGSKRGLLHLAQCYEQGIGTEINMDYVLVVLSISLVKEILSPS